MTSLDAGVAMTDVSTPRSPKGKKKKPKENEQKWTVTKTTLEETSKSIIILYKYC